MIENPKRVKGLALTQHIAHQQGILRATGEFSAVLGQISLAGKVIARKLSQAGLFERIGSETYHPGDYSKSMDLFAKETFIKAFTHAPWISTLMTSEDLENEMNLNTVQDGKYIVFVDALDGAANLEVNGGVGSIFSVYRRSGSGSKASAKELLQKGADQVASGYIMYGPATVLVYSAGDGVNVYTLDRGVGEFLLSQENIRIPERGLHYSCNEANCQSWHDPLTRYIDHLRKRDPKSDKYYASRYAGSLIPDFHRILIQGGIYICPGDLKDPAKPKGKRLLIYECNPLAFIAEQAGGRATTGTDRISKLQPASLDQRCPFTVGSPYEVRLYEDFVMGKR